MKPYSEIYRAEQGKYLAATGLQVRSPEDAMLTMPRGADLFVMNRNYLGEIKKMTASKFNYIAVDSGAI